MTFIASEGLGSQKSAPIVIFKDGDFGSANFRIPAMIATMAGTVLIGTDARYDQPGDNPNHIDMWVRRSTDNGDTWDDPIVVIDYPGVGSKGSAAIDSSLLQDETTGRIFLLCLHTPGGIGLWQSELSMSFDEQGRRVVFHKQGEETTTYYLDESSGVLYDAADQPVSGVIVAMPVGDVLIDGEKSEHNIYLHVDETDWYEARTSFLTLHHSDDDGLSWSDPICLNTQVKASWMKFIGAGPGNGIQLQNGPHAGRLVFPIYFNNPGSWMSAAVIYSDDHGATWQRGESPNDGRMWDGRAITAETMNKNATDLTESQVVELSDGTLKLYMRNHARNGKRAVADSHDRGHTWGEVYFDETLTDPVCQATVISLSNAADDRIVFANPNADERKNGTVRLSEDGGKTWPYAKVVEPGDYIYSSLAVLPNGWIGLYYETVGARALHFTKFTVDWLKQPL